ncbi:hypothetical protein D3C72_1570720 [compost metagenome]
MAWPFSSYSARLGQLESAPMLSRTCVALSCAGSVAMSWMWLSWARIRAFCALICARSRIGASALSRRAAQ